MENAGMRHVALRGMMRVCVCVYCEYIYINIYIYI